MKVFLLENAAFTTQTSQIAVIRTVFPDIRVEESNIFALPPTYIFNYCRPQKIGYWESTKSLPPYVLDNFLDGTAYEVFRPFVHKFGAATAESLVWLAPNTLLLKQLKLYGWITEGNGTRTTFHHFVSGPNDRLVAE